MKHLRRPNTEPNTTARKSTASDTPCQNMAQRATVKPLRCNSGPTPEHYTRLNSHIVQSMAQVEVCKLSIKGMQVPNKGNASRKGAGRNRVHDQHKLPHGDHFFNKGTSKGKPLCVPLTQHFAVPRPLCQPLQFSIRKATWDNFSLHTQHEGLQFQRPLLPQPWFKCGFHAYSVPFNGNMKPSQERAYLIFDYRAENFFSRMHPSFKQSNFLKSSTDSKGMLHINGLSLSKSRTASLRDTSTQTTADMHCCNLPDGETRNDLEKVDDASDSKGLKNPNTILNDNSEDTQKSEDSCMCIKVDITSRHCSSLLDIDARNNMAMVADASKSKSVKYGEGMENLKLKDTQETEKSCSCLKVDSTTRQSEPHKKLLQKVPLENKETDAIPKPALPTMSYLSVPLFPDTFAEDKGIQRFQSKAGFSVQGPFRCIPGIETCPTKDVDEEESEITIHVPVLKRVNENREQTFVRK